jgi:hypothetical protein
MRATEGPSPRCVEERTLVAEFQKRVMKALDVFNVEHDNIDRSGAFTTDMVALRLLHVPGSSLLCYYFPYYLSTAHSSRFIPDGRYKGFELPFVHVWCSSW